MVLIAQISDLHLVPEGNLCGGRVDTNELARRAVAAINRLKTRPTAVVVSGDVIDTAEPKDYAVARNILGRLEMPYYLASGNHDHSAGMQNAFTAHPSANSPFADRICYAVDIGPIRLVTLDSSVPGALHGALSLEQLSFLDRELTAARNRPVLITVHHPPIDTGNAFMDRIGLADPTGLADVVERYPNVLRILCGHCHRAVFGGFAGTTVVIAPATGHQLELALDGDDTLGFNLEPPGIFLHRWTEGDGMTTHLAFVDRFPGPYRFSGIDQ